MDSIDRQVYAIVLNDLYVEITDDLRELNAFGQKIPFALISGLIFLCVLTAFFRDGLQVSSHTAVTMIVLCGAGCMMSVLELFINSHALRKIQAMCSIIGNAYFMLML